MTSNTAPVPAMGGREWVMLLALAALWGGSFFFFKVLVAGLPPFTVVLGRVGLAAVALNLWLGLRCDFMPASPRLWTGFIVMGVLNNIIPFSLIVFGETRISSGLASILNATTPMFTVLVAHMLTANEKLEAGKFIGVMVGFAGVAVLVEPGALAGTGGENAFGEAACLGAAFVYAVAGIYGRRFKDVSPIKVATGQVTGSTIVLIPVVALVDHPWTSPAPDATTWGALIGIALLCTALAYILYFRILAVAGATNLLLVTFLIPASAILLGSIVLGEPLLVRELIGMAVIGVGLAFIDGRPFAAFLPRSRPARCPASAACPAARTVSATRPRHRRFQRRRLLRHRLLHVLGSLLHRGCAQLRRTPAEAIALAWRGPPVRRSTDVTHMATGAMPNSQGWRYSSTAQAKTPMRTVSQPISPGTKRLRPCTIAANGVIEVAAASAFHAAGSRRANFASIKGMPASAVTRNAPKNSTAAASPLPMT